MLPGRHGRQAVRLDGVQLGGEFAHFPEMVVDAHHHGATRPYHPEHLAQGIRPDVAEGEHADGHSVVVGVAVDVQTGVEVSLEELPVDAGLRRPLQHGWREVAAVQAGEADIPQGDARKAGATTHVEDMTAGVGHPGQGCGAPGRLCVPVVDADLLVIGLGPPLVVVEGLITGLQVVCGAQEAFGGRVGHGWTLRTGEPVGGAGCLQETASRQAGWCRRITKR